MKITKIIRAVLLPHGYLTLSIVPALIGAGGAIISGLVSKRSAKDQMEFQEEMSNTAHQREIKDLKLAGLNPILSAKYGGASTPLGAGYQMPNIASSAKDAASMSLSNAQKVNVAKQGNILDREMTLAEIDEKLYKRFPWIRAAEKLQDVNPAVMAGTAALNYGEQALADGANSAKTFGTAINRFKGKENKLRTSTQPIDQKYLPGGISPKEMKEINRQIRQQAWEKSRKRHR